MVGIRTSSGCDTCRRRKKKCGEERPECRACVSSGWKCPGYARSWRFVSENSQLSRYFRNKKYLFDSELVDLENWALGAPDGAGAGMRLHVFSIARPPQPTSAERAVGMFAHVLTDPKCQSVFSPQAVGGFFLFIPSHLGRNAALDTAIPCLYSIYGDLLASRKDSRETTLKYIACLETLRACVKDPVLRVQSETLCASLIVQICELILDPNTKKYSALLIGSRILIQDAGPERFREGFTRAMLELQRAPFIAQDIASRGHCFLSEPKWRDLPEEPLGPPDLTTLAIRLRARLTDFLVHVPGLVQEARLLLTTSATQNDHCLKRLAVRTTDLKHSLEVWYENDVFPHICSTKPDGINQIKFIHDRDYPGLLFGFLDCVICSLLVKLDDLSASLESASNSDMRLTTSPIGCDSYTAHREVARSASIFVQAQSDVTAKQLSFGLKNLGYAFEFGT